MGGSKKVDPNALISDKLKSMNAAMAAGETLASIDEQELEPGHCVVEFESASMAVMEDVGKFLVKLVRRGDATKPARVKLDTIDGSAEAGDDYIEVHEVVTFEAGQAEIEYEIEIVDDDEWEPDEEFYLKVIP